MNGEDSLKTKRPSFVEKWAQAEETSVSLRITLYGLMFFCAILLFTLYKIATKQEAVYYVPGANEAGVSYPNRVDKSVITGFAASWLLNRNNFTPATVKDAYERAMRYMAPELLSRTRASLEDEMSRIGRDNISSLFSLNGEPEVTDSGAGYKVALTGEKALYMGKEKLDDKILRYTITLKRTAPLETNPYGLVVEGVKQEEVKKR